jgi:hypothetical protein
MRFGRLIVTSRDPSDRRRPHFICLCDCGQLTSVAASALHRGYTRSCGCLHRERAAELGRQNATHGEARHGRQTPEYRAWGSMIARCYDTRSPSYSDYGGRGVTVCDRWRDSFEAFLSDIGRRPSPHHSVDRLNNDRGYEPGNVRWATKLEQTNNRRTTVFVEFQGERLSVSEIARRVGMSDAVLRKRLARGWTLERALALRGRQKPGPRPASQRVAL